jgi:hypothetical protein
VTLSAGTAATSTTTLPLGTSTVTATYNPTSNFSGSSGTVKQLVD